MASDIDRIYEAMEALHWLWQTPLLLIVTLYVLWYRSFMLRDLLGALPTLGGLASLLLLVAFTAVANRRFHALKKKASAQTDVRVGRTTELIKNLEIVKSLALEPLIAVLCHTKLRRKFKKPGQLK